MAEYNNDDYYDTALPYFRHEVNGDTGTLSQISLDYFTIGTRTDVPDGAAPTVSVVGSIDLNSDVDFYRFDVLQDDLGITLNFDVDDASGNGLDSKIQLFDANGSFIAENDDSTNIDNGSGLDRYDSDTTPFGPSIRH